MARELRIVHNSSATVYAILRRATDDAVWNGSSFETWADANIAAYDIELTNRGGDLYTGDFPAGVDSGTYSVYFYRRAGSVPATSDEFLGGRELVWSGDAVASSTGSYLTTLERAKRYAGITSTSYDTKLTELLAAATTFIERYCNTHFIADDYVEYHNGTGGRYIQTYNIPIIRITRLAASVRPAMRVSYSGDGALAFVRVLSDSVVLQSETGGTTSSTTLDFATYATLESLATAIAGTSGWTASVEGDFAGRASADLVASPALDAKNAPACLEMAKYNLHCSSYNPDSGMVCGSFPRGWRNIEVRYRAGYDTIPDDVQTAACMIVKAMHDMSRRDTTLQSERIGDYAYANGVAPATPGLAGLSREAALLLDAYRNVGVA